MLSLISILLRNKKTVIIVTVAAFVVSAVVSLIIPPRYIAWSALLPRGIEQEITGLRDLFSSLGELGESYSMFLRARKNLLIVFVIRSRRMSDIISERFELEEVYGVRGGERVQGRLHENTGVEIKDEGVIILGVEDRRPDRALAMAEAYCQVLDSLLIELNVEHAEQRIRFLNDELARREMRISRLDSIMRNFMEEHGVYEIEQQARAALGVASVLRARLSMLDVEKRLLEMTLRSESPELKSVEIELEKLREQLLAIREGTGERPELFPPLSEFPDLAAEYVRLYSERKTHEFMLAYIHLKLEEAKISASRRVSVLRVLDPPVLPERRAWPKRKQIVLVSTFAAFFWISFALLVLEKWKEGVFRLELQALGRKETGHRVEREHRDDR